FPCEHPWNELVISADGTAGLCCLDFDCTAVVGDARAATLKEIWNGKKMNFYRNRLLELDYSNIVCEKCNAYIFQKKSFWRALWV
ncbi:MAG: SPASM domain-containing protein, partial [Nitrospinota bacterium]